MKKHFKYNFQYDGGMISNVFYTVSILQEKTYQN